MGTQYGWISKYESSQGFVGSDKNVVISQGGGDDENMSISSSD